MVFLMVVILVIGCLISIYAIKPTFAKIAEYKELESQFVTYADLTNRKDSVDLDIENVENEIRRDFAIGNTAVTYLQNEVDTLMKRADIKEYRFKRNNDIGYHHGLVYTFELSLLETFPEINKVVAKLKQDVATARITSVTMKQIRSQPGAPKLMETIIYFQQVSKLADKVE